MIAIFAHPHARSIAWEAVWALACTERVSVKAWDVFSLSTGNEWPERAAVQKRKMARKGHLQI